MATNAFKIPRSADYKTDAKGSGYPCVVCGRPVEHPIYEVECVDGGSDLCVTPGTANESDPGYMGYYPVGVKCLKKHPELAPFVLTRVGHK